MSITPGARFGPHEIVAPLGIRLGPYKIQSPLGRHARDDADYEWAAFAAQQAAEKALKALVLARGLDKHYIPARDPNGFAVGYPGKLYTHGEAVSGRSLHPDEG